MSGAIGSWSIVLTVRRINPIIRPQVVEPDEIHSVAHSISRQEQGEVGGTQRLVSCLFDFLIYAVSTPVYSPVLSSKDSFNGSLVLNIS